MNRERKPRTACCPARALIAAAALACMTQPPSPAGAADVDFLVPGVSLGSIEFEKGAAVSYLVISEAHGIRDTSTVGLEVICSGGEDIELEIVSSDWPGSVEETVAVRLRLCPEAGEAASAEEFFSCVRSIRVREGAGEYREPSPEEIGDFEIERLFLGGGEGTETRSLGEEEIATPAGTFECRVLEHARAETREISLGGFEAVRSEKEISVLHMSSRVPFWGLVRSRVERRVTTEYSGEASAPPSRPAVTVTESVLRSFTTPDDSG